MRWTGRAAVVLAAVCAACLPLTACTASRPDSTAPLTGASIEVLGGWHGVEQARFQRVLQAFTARTGALVRYVSSGQEYLPDVLDDRLARGVPPDVVMLSEPGILRHYAADGDLRPLDAATRRLTEQHYAPSWRALASYAGQQYGVWFKAANKSLVWYDVATFERYGVVPPDDLAGLRRIATTLRRGGIVPFAVGAADGWTLTDWFENIFLRLAGPSDYDALTTHRMRWTDPTVGRALVAMHDLLSSADLLGGSAGALGISFESSVARAFTPPAHAAMLVEGDFVAGFLPTQVKDRIGTQVDVFPFPGSYHGLPMVMGGGDIAVQLTPATAATALMRFLASPEAAAIWAAEGGFVSPNLDLDLSVYPDAISRGIARSVLEAGNDFRFDLSDSQPAAFGAAPRSGMQGALRSFLVDGNVRVTQQRLEAAATAALGR
jgi:ABC-type glycerol-3-phosphate transport system substrate-binding protein